MKGLEMKTQEIMRVLWKNETGENWDALYEYPYSDFDRARIIPRLEKTASEIVSLMRTDA